MSAVDAARSRYSDAIHHLDDVINAIEDIPVSQLPQYRCRETVRLLAEAYELRRAVTTARDELTP